MKVLWIVNNVFPYPAKQLSLNSSVFGGWLLGLMDSLTESRDIKLAIATVYDGNEIKKYIDNTIVYYLIPCKNKYKYNRNLEKKCRYVFDDFKADIVHLQGTEFPYGLAFLNANKEVKSIASIQGLVSYYGKLYLMNIPNKDIIKNITIRDIIKMDNMFQASRKFLKRGKYEIEILKKVDKIIGRTSWDYSAVMSITNKNKYIFCNENLRNSFYENSWEYSNIEKHTIFVSQASYPIKGFHELIKALPVIKQSYPDVKVYVSGDNIIDRTSFKQKLKLSGYAKYLLKLMKKHNVVNNIEFIGLQNESEIVNKLLRSNVFVQTSIIENSSNSLGEAMLLGMPIVASNVGGTSDMLRDKEEGYLYPYGEENLLAKYIIDIFDNEDLAINMGLNAKHHAIKTHDRKSNANNMINIYRSMLDENQE